VQCQNKELAAMPKPILDQISQKKLLTNDDISTFGPKSHGHGISQDIHAAGEGLTPFISKGNLLVRRVEGLSIGRAEKSQRAGRGRQSLKQRIHIFLFFVSLISCHSGAPQSWCHP
jgi:hypothetical protein